MAVRQHYTMLLLATMTCTLAGLASAREPRSLDNRQSFSLGILMGQVEDSEACTVLLADDLLNNADARTLHQQSPAAVQYLGEAIPGEDRCGRILVAARMGYSGD